MHAATAVNHAFSLEISLLEVFLNMDNNFSSLSFKQNLLLFCRSNR